MTTKKNYRISNEIKDEVLKKIKEEGVTVVGAAENYGISTKTIYNWLSRGATGFPSFQEVARLKRQNQELMALVGELTMKLSQAQKKM